MNHNSGSEEGVGAEKIHLKITHNFPWGRIGYVKLTPNKLSE